jgi:thioredoxin
MKLLKFSADWCGPCKALDRELDKLPDLDVIRVDVDKDTGATRLHQIRSVPVLILLDENDKEIGRLAGRQTAAAIERFVNEAV